MPFVTKSVRKMTENSRKRICINREGRRALVLVSAILVILNLVLLLTSAYGWWSIVAIVLSLFLIGFLLYFFRNPQRSFPGEDTEKVVVSPADGTVVAIEEVDEPDYFKDRRMVISIFMSIYSVHANWFPVNGTVRVVKHHNGNFHAAFKPKASTENERSMVVIETPEGNEVMIRQIAGALARRIVTYCKPGDKSSIDRHMGFIKFGSRVDIYLPVDSLICVKMNQKVTGNITILAKLA